ncbi:MAG: type II secretion system protein [Phycisphaerae bacterium]
MNTRSRGFTLIELLVVIAIIALLVSILLPSIARAKQLAVDLKCQTNLSAMGKASNLYAAENNGGVPRDFDSRYPNNQYFFATRLARYTGASEDAFDLADERVGLGYNADHEEIYQSLKKADLEVLRCPALSINEDYYVHYVANAIKNLEKNPGGSAGVTDVGDIRAPLSDVYYLVEFNPDALNPKQYAKYDFWDFKGTTFSATGNVNSNPRMIHADDQRHQGNGTGVFFDGHAESRELIYDNYRVENFETIPLD